MTFEATLEQIRRAETWDQRVQAIRRVPELHGQSVQPAIYAAIAQELYVPALAPQFAYIPSREDYELPAFQSAYRSAQELTEGFTLVTPGHIAHCLTEAPQTLAVFRTIIGYTPGEFAVAVSEVRAERGNTRVSQQRIKSIEAGAAGDEELATDCARTIDRLILREMWAPAPEGLRTKLDKPDTQGGWESVRKAAREGVPYDVLLHQRHYGGAFRQLLDATSGQRGELLEQPVDLLLAQAGVPFIRTGPHNQGEIANRFGLTVRPAPDFVVFSEPSTLRAMIECKQANDGGTARDKAARYRSLRTEGTRLGGVPVFAVLDGLGWERVNDALGPVVRDTDGRVFTLSTLEQMLDVQPFPQLAATLRGRRTGLDAF